MSSSTSKSNSRASQANSHVTPTRTSRYPVAPAPTEPEALQFEDIPVPSRDRVVTMLANRKRHRLRGPTTMVSFETGLERRDEQERVWHAIAGSAKPISLRAVETFTGRTKRMKQPVPLDTSDDDSEDADVGTDEKQINKQTEAVEKRKFLTSYIPHHYPPEQISFYRQRLSEPNVANVECERCLNFSFCRAKPSFMLYNESRKTWMCQMCLHILSLPAAQRVLPCPTTAAERVQPGEKYTFPYRPPVRWPRPYRRRPVPVLSVHYPTKRAAKR